MRRAQSLARKLVRAPVVATTAIRLGAPWDLFTAVDGRRRPRNASTADDLPAVEPLRGPSAWHYSSGGIDCSGVCCRASSEDGSKARWNRGHLGSGISGSFQDSTPHAIISISRPMARAAPSDPKSIIWMGSSRRDVQAFPVEVQKGVGYALWFAKIGDKHPHAKPLRGFGGAGVIEIIEDFRGDTYRAVYTVKLGGFVYVLHAFQKKSRRGTAMPQGDLELIRSRLRATGADYRARKEAE